MEGDTLRGGLAHPAYTPGSALPGLVLPSLQEGVLWLWRVSQMPSAWLWRANDGIFRLKHLGGTYLASLVA